jgi:hypothetical protein
MHSVFRDTSGQKAVCKNHFRQGTVSCVSICQNHHSWNERWLVRSPRFTHSVLHSRVTSVEHCRVMNSKSNHLKWINRAWKPNALVRSMSLLHNWDSINTNSQVWRHHLIHKRSDIQIARLSALCKSILVSTN